jgi:D-tyrosyl-tRNA(Tyr) deacylase
MRAIVQRVTHAAVEVSGATASSIDKGLLVYLGVAPEDGEEDITYLAEKVRFLRIFADDQGKLNLDVVQADGAVLVVSAFTVQADARKGRRPSFDAAADPDTARGLYERACDAIAAHGATVKQGSFRAMMAVSSVNDGPICVLLDSKRLF